MNNPLHVTNSAVPNRIATITRGTLLLDFMADLNQTLRLLFFLGAFRIPEQIAKAQTAQGSGN